MKNTEVTKAVKIDEILDKFLKDGAQILAKSISELCILSMVLMGFSDAAKIVKLKTSF